MLSGIREAFCDKIPGFNVPQSVSAALQRGVQQITKIAIPLILFVAANNAQGADAGPLAYAAGMAGCAAMPPVCVAGGWAACLALLAAPTP